MRHRAPRSPPWLLVASGSVRQDQMLGLRKRAPRPDVGPSGGLSAWREGEGEEKGGGGSAPDMSGEGRYLCPPPFMLNVYIVAQECFFHQYDLADRSSKDVACLLLIVARLNMSITEEQHYRYRALCHMYHASRVIGSVALRDGSILNRRHISLRFTISSWQLSRRSAAFQP